MRTVLSLLLFASSVHAADLTITFPDAQRGVVYVSVFANVSDWSQADRSVARTKIVASSSTQAVFHDLPAGTYAARAFLDLNGNGELDKNFMGMPKEPYGFSKDAPSRFGPASFADAAFELPATGLVTTIHLPE